MTHPLHRLAPFTLRLFVALMARDDRSPLTETQRTAVWACLKDHGWRVGGAGPVPMATLEAWYDRLQGEWKCAIHSGDIDKNSGTE